MKNETFKSVTDERLVIDITAVGFNRDTVTVKACRVNGGKAFKLVIEGKYKGRTNINGVPVPKLAFEKEVKDFKITLSDDTNFGDCLFCSKTFTSEDYDLDAMVYDVRDGVIRLSIPKTTLARGKVVSPSNNADEASTGVITSDATNSPETPFTDTTTETVITE